MHGIDKRPHSVKCLGWEFAIGKKAEKVGCLHSKVDQESLIIPRIYTKPLGYCVKHVSAKQIVSLSQQLLVGAKAVHASAYCPSSLQAHQSRSTVTVASIFNEQTTQFSTLQDI